MSFLFTAVSADPAEAAFFIDQKSPKMGEGVCFSGKVRYIID